MLKQLEGARLGIFIFFGTVLLVISIFLLGSKEKLFTRTIEIKAYFTQIEGLKSGAPVRLSGYDIGSVSSVSFASDTTARVEVKMRIDSDLKYLIRIDSEASIETEGLVGKKIVSITPGGADAAVIESGGIIKSKTPMNISRIIEQTESVMGYMKDLTKDFSEIFAKVNAGQGTIGKLFNNDDLYKSAVSVTQSADKNMNTITKRLDEIADIIVNTSGSLKSIVGNVDVVIGDIKSLLNNVEHGEGVLGKLIADKKMADSISSVIKNLVKTSEQTRIATASLVENMEALKHNWLFKGYFESRGYWSQSEYEKALELQMNDLKKQHEAIDKKMIELKALEEKLQKK